MPETGSLSFAPELFISLLFPLISKDYSLGKIKLIKELTKQIGKWILIINIPILLLIIIYPGTIINLLFGQE